MRYTIELKEGPRIAFYLVDEWPIKGSFTIIVHSCFISLKLSWIGLFGRPLWSWNVNCNRCIEVFCLVFSGFWKIFTKLMAILLLYSMEDPSLCTGEAFVIWAREIVYTIDSNARQSSGPINIVRLTLQLVPEFSPFSDVFFLIPRSLSSQNSHVS